MMRAGKARGLVVLGLVVVLFSMEGCRMTVESESNSPSPAHWPTTTQRENSSGVRGRNGKSDAAASEELSSLVSDIVALFERLVAKADDSGICAYFLFQLQWKGGNAGSTVLRPRGAWIQNPLTVGLVRQLEPVMVAKFGDTKGPEMVTDVHKRAIAACSEQDVERRLDRKIRRLEQVADANNGTARMLKVPGISADVQKKIDDLEAKILSGFEKKMREGRGIPLFIMRPRRFVDLEQIALELKDAIVDKAPSTAFAPRLWAFAIEVINAEKRFERYDKNAEAIFGLELNHVLAPQATKLHHKRVATWWDTLETVWLPEVTQDIKDLRALVKVETA